MPRPPRKVDPGAALLPLRLFLGLTFVYAGVQKLGDPGFLHPGSPTYIGTQLHGFASGTPGGFLLRAFALPHPKLAGVGVALLEIAIGLLVTSGLLTRAAAAAGLGLNLVLFLTNSWHSYPYFLGSDIVFVFAWMPFVLAGAAGQPALDGSLLRRGGTRQPIGRASTGEGLVSRRDLLLRAVGIAGLATLGIGGGAALAKGSYRGRRRTASLGSPGPAAPKPQATHAAKANNPASAPVPAGAKRIGPASRLRRNQGATYKDPGDGQPDIVVRDGQGQLRAFSAVCTHAGCTVGYQNGQIVCPCHGGTYDPSTGAVTGGPPPQGLAARRVIESGGDLYAMSD